MTYQQQIKDPRWQKKRLETFEASGFECQECGTKEEELHVHHPFYRRGAMIWEYEATELRVLCHKCHKNAHALDEQLKNGTSTLIADEKYQLLGYLDSISGLIPRMDDDCYLKGFLDGIKSNQGAVSYLLQRGQLCKKPLSN